jgi:hypothetical protein
MYHHYNPLGIEVGDKVQFPKYKTQTMSGLWFEGTYSERTGVISRTFAEYNWMGADNMALIRCMSGGEDGQADGYETRYALDQLILLEKGDGRFELGVTHPYSHQELKDQRWKAFKLKVENTDTRHQGFVNIASFLAHLHISQERRFFDTVFGMRRKDGSVNPDKIRKLYSQNFLALRIDDYAHECPIDIPDEFIGWASRVKQSIDWNDVAKAFKEDFKAM